MEGEVLEDDIQNISYLSNRELFNVSEEIGTLIFPHDKAAKNRVITNDWEDLDPDDIVASNTELNSNKALVKRTSNVVAETQLDDSEVFSGKSTMVVSRIFNESYNDVYDSDLVPISSNDYVRDSLENGQDTIDDDVEHIARYVINGSDINGRVHVSSEETLAEARDFVKIWKSALDSPSGDLIEDSSSLREESDAYSTASDDENSFDSKPLLVIDLGKFIMSLVDNKEQAMKLDPTRVVSMIWVTLTEFRSPISKEELLSRSSQANRNLMKKGLRRSVIEGVYEFEQKSRFLDIPYPISGSYPAGVLLSYAPESPSEESLNSFIDPKVSYVELSNGGNQSSVSFDSFSAATEALFSAEMLFHSSTDALSVDVRSWCSSMERLREYRRNGEWGVAGPLSGKEDFEYSPQSVPTCLVVLPYPTHFASAELSLLWSRVTCPWQIPRFPRSLAPPSLLSAPTASSAPADRNEAVLAVARTLQTLLEGCSRDLSHKVLLGASFSFALSSAVRSAALLPPPEHTGDELMDSGRWRLQRPSDLAKLPLVRCVAQLLDRSPEVVAVGSHFLTFSMQREASSERGTLNRPNCTHNDPFLVVEGERDRHAARALFALVSQSSDAANGVPYWCLAGSTALADVLDLWMSAFDSLDFELPRDASDLAQTTPSQSLQPNPGTSAEETAQWLMTDAEFAAAGGGATTIGIISAPPKNPSSETRPNDSSRLRTREKPIEDRRPERFSGTKGSQSSLVLSHTKDHDKFYENSPTQGKSDGSTPFGLVFDDADAVGLEDDPMFAFLMREATGGGSSSSSGPGWGEVDPSEKILGSRGNNTNSRHIPSSTSRVLEEEGPSGRHAVLEQGYRADSVSGESGAEEEEGRRQRKTRKIKKKKKIDIESFLADSQAASQPERPPKSLYELDMSTIDGLMQNASEQLSRLALDLGFRNQVMEPRQNDGATSVKDAAAAFLDNYTLEFEQRTALQNGSAGKSGPGQVNNLYAGLGGRALGVPGVDDPSEQQQKEYLLRLLSLYPDSSQTAVDQSQSKFLNSARYTEKPSALSVSARGSKGIPLGKKG